MLAAAVEQHDIDAEFIASTSISGRGITQ